MLQFRLGWLWALKIAVGSGGKRRQDDKLPVSSKGVRDPLEVRARV